ncbi:glycosyl transferase 1 family protein [[Clostridium] bifermentans ATCC 638]|uniref:Glycosyl transferase 1 family protein n=1 Tax=Paraclostridium bifermentans ATCC 638 = DSM 14991 TaxID=1233171 RepID=T4VF02_PARBF|nr:UDP-2,4-diacetamido-2,4,6-trideoxy-beta-L-altropyranose hydrolase [Paraclostridium bifermentans]EQK42304.1 glycosyl transferase 1 family protein [[Clostridium] bifermentans ATCC 638] [Paraclostridium bifermentans ATCC 638 = DSM 14991]UAG19156.1 UDP-2,4-diacetamido-2,4,6-trideoxy-beta-L-altropyranose hydrolase [Paraclostridium bifermentans]
MNYVAIRAGGNKNQGLGHVARCISLAQELIFNNFKVFFLIDDDTYIIDFLNKHRFEYKSLTSKNLNLEIKETKKIIKDLNIDLLITDSYNLNNFYFKEMKNTVKYLVSIDDTNLYDYISDIVINYNIYAHKLNYKFNDETRYLLGCNYCLFRKEFQENDYISINKTCTNVLITMGGTDVNNYTYTILKYLYEFNYINFNVIINEKFNNLNKLKALASCKSNINLIFNPDNMKSIMLKNDIAISASGSTAYELLSLSIPSILIIQADNQELICKELSNINTCIYGGWFYELTEDKFNEIFAKLTNNYEFRKSISDNCKGVVCKTGVKNVVNEIKKLFK